MAADVNTAVAGSFETIDGTGALGIAPRVGGDDCGSVGGSMGGGLEDEAAVCEVRFEGFAVPAQEGVAETVDAAFGEVDVVAVFEERAGIAIDSEGDALPVAEIAEEQL